MGANGMVYIGELDAYWRNLVEAYSKEKLDGAAVVCFPKVPMPAINHIADVNLDADRSLKLITRAEKYFAAKGLVSSCFRVSPSTRPTNFAQTLKKRGYSSRENNQLWYTLKTYCPKVSTVKSL